VEVITGEHLCEFHYNQVPRSGVVGCPNCSPLAADSTAASPPVAGVETAGDASAEVFPSSAEASIATGVGVSPATPAPVRHELDKLLHDLRGCVQFCKDQWKPLDPMDEAQINRALCGLDVLANSVRALAAYASLSVAPADDPEWRVVTSWVPASVVEDAYAVLRKVKP
jgi:hypothetical protein